MLIAQIMGLLIPLIVSIVFCILKKYYKPPKYEICVMGGMNTLTMSVLYIFGSLFIVFSMFSGNSGVGIVGSLILYGFGMFLGIIPFIIGIYDYLFDYTVFSDDKIILKRLFFTKELHVSEIDRITCSRGIICFYKKPVGSKYYKALFVISESATDAAELVHKIDERRIALGLSETNE